MPRRRLSLFLAQRPTGHVMCVMAEEITCPLQRHLVSLCHMAGVEVEHGQRYDVCYGYRALVRECRVCYAGQDAPGTRHWRDGETSWMVVRSSEALCANVTALSRVRSAGARDTRHTTSTERAAYTPHMGLGRPDALAIEMLRWGLRALCHQQAPTRVGGIHRLAAQLRRRVAGREVLAGVKAPSCSRSCSARTPTL